MRFYIIKQLHKKFTDYRIKEPIARYLKKKIHPRNFRTKYNQKVSLPTIIDRAKRNNFYFLRPKRKAPEKVVITNYPGELIQHDSSHRQLTPYTDKK